MIVLEVKFESKINEVIEEIADHGNAAIAAIQGTLDCSPRNLMKRNL